MLFQLIYLNCKKVLIVNVASKSNLTPQYKELEELYKKYKDQDFVVIAFPSNDFKGQEPGTNEEIKRFCIANYHITFPIMNKVIVIGDGICPLYQWLTTKSENGKLNTIVQWDFQKFMIDECGQLVNFIIPSVSPMCNTIVNWLENNRQNEEKNQQEDLIF